MKMMPIILFLGLVVLWGCDKDSTSSTDSLEAETTVTNVSVFGGGDGAVDATVSGGETPYQYAWSNGAVTEDISNLTAGDYTLTVTDADEETVIVTATVNQPPDLSTVTDIDGNVYPTIQIGDQLWMAENLKVTHDPQGNAIPFTMYDDDAANGDTYGLLYDWDTAMNGSTTAGAQGIAPDGWHIPTDAEWQTLLTFLGGAPFASGKMKTTGTTHWLTPNTGATNSSGFSALPAGENDNGVYKFLNEWTLIWTSNQTSNDKALYYGLAYDSNNVRQIEWFKNFGYSVRCIKD